jgi:DNA-binding transcriptional MerR regulator
MSNADSNTVISAFTEDQVERLTGISKSQLRYWDRTGFFAPTFADENRRVTFSRIYSFKDVAALRVLHVLRNQYSVSLQHLRKVAKELPQLSDAKWLTTELFVLNKKVVFVEPNTEKYREILSKQYVTYPLRIVVSSTKHDIAEMQARNDNMVGKLHRARNVSHNALVVAGTRIPVATIKRFAEDGFSIEQIRGEYPTLTEADIKAAIAHRGDGLAA